MSRWTLRLASRHWVILLVSVVAAMILASSYLTQVRVLEASLLEQESLRLRERLSLEQNQLDLLTAADNRLALRRQVSAMALYTGLRHAFLVGPDAQVLASLSRADVGRSLEQALDARPDLVGDARESLLKGKTSVIDVAVTREAGTLLVGQVPIQDGSRLAVVADLEYPRTQRVVALENELIRETVVLVVVMVILTAFLHLIWFRRAQRLVKVLDSIGMGQLQLRADMKGADELAFIGRAADKMAERLQEDQQSLRQMQELINRSPAVVIEWEPAPGWPILKISESVSQWGYAPADLTETRLPYLQLIHPDDLTRIESEVGEKANSREDVFVQEYRIRCADGRWAWLEDRTRFDRDDRGHLRRITGVLMDITDRREAQRAQREQADQMRRFFDLPFIGMAISDPVTKTWVQVNDRLCQILGYRRDELVGASWAEMTHPDDLVSNVALFDEVVRGQRDGYQLAKRFVRKDGSVVDVEMDVRAVREADGSLRHLFTTVEDVTERKRAQQLVAQSEHRLREAQRIARMGHWEIEVATGATHWSDETYRIHGFDPADPAPVFDRAMLLVHPQDKERLVQAFDRLTAHQQAFEADYRIVLPDGQPRHLHVKAEPVVEFGQVRRLVGTVQDVTDLVEARQARDRLGLVLESTTDLVSMTDADGEAFYFNRAARDFWGMSDETPLDSVLHRIHRPEVARYIAEVAIPAAIRDGVWRGETPTLAADGREVPMSQLIMAHRDSEGKVLYLSTMMRDISDVKQAAREIEQRGEMLQQAESIARLGSWTLDLEKQELRWSSQMFINVGLPVADQPPSMEGFCARIHPDDVAQVRAAIDLTQQGQDVPEVIFRTHPDHGPLRWLRRTVRRVDRSAQGLAPRYMGTLLDITEAVHSEERLRDINQELEQRVAERTEQLSRINKELESFTYSVSHDLKAPLRGIDGYSQLLEEEYGSRLDEEARQFLRRIRRGVQQMGDLITDLLDYSRMERRTMERHDVELQPLVDQMLEFHSADIERLGTQVINHVEPMHLAIDRDGLAVALRNLIGNAIKFSQDRQPPQIEIGAHAENGKKHIWVRDNGVGFDMKYHDRIFGIFQRLHRSEEYAGTGVGLAMVAKTVERMGGRVWAESVPGQGATFHMEFPD